MNAQSSLTPSYLLDQLKRWPKAPTYWVGYSGGIDSSVLLTLLAAIRPSLQDSAVRAIHVHHGLHELADQWSEHCSSYCRELQVPLVIRAVDALNAAGESPEEAARNSRYEAFAAIMEPEDVLLLAQHQDDQAETFLLQLFRGAGPRGLSAMPLRTSFQEGHLLRPFL
ncbi:MAG: tRNA lysidine(34) synthetase TilS, partial [Gammaproteobacteria bacterium]|nr:tRNA lysidine(34) synthetase TilS [Gammaproteobacteria bacterium]